MKVLCICRASVSDGLGHLMRCMTFSDKLVHLHPEIDLRFMLVTDLALEHHLIDKPYKYTISSELATAAIADDNDILFLDLLSLSSSQINDLKSRCKRVVSLSPIFNQMSSCDVLVTRTKYLGGDKSHLPPRVLAGLQYAIIRANVQKINTAKYSANMDRSSLHVGISMGGTDPLNHTLNVVKHLKQVDIPVVFWVLLGESYTYHYDALVAEIKGHSKHEMILARTNKNMWEVLGNCDMAILTGGLTSYEAAYAGLPAINYFSDKKKGYLVRELEEENLCLETCYDFALLPQLLINYYEAKNQLLAVNERAQEYRPLAVLDMKQILTVGAQKTNTP